MLNVVSKIKAKVFIPDEPVQEYLETWEKSMIAAVPKILQGMSRLIKSVEDYTEKLVNPRIEVQKQCFNPNFRSKNGRTYLNIIATMEANKQAGYEAYKENTDSANGEKVKIIIERIKKNAYQVALRRSQRCFPFMGYKDQIRGVAPFVARWLTGDSAVRKLVMKEDKEVLGFPIMICAPERAGEFRRELINRLKHAGARIVRAGFSEKIISEENDATNRLVQEFVNPDLRLSPFAPGADSHLDYIVENGQLYLSVKVSQ